MKKQTEEKLRSNVPDFMERMDKSLGKWNAPIIRKEYCKCGKSRVQIVTESYEFCGECGGVVRDLSF